MKKVLFFGLFALLIVGGYFAYDYFFNKDSNKDVLHLEYGAYKDDIEVAKGKEIVIEKRFYKLKITITEVTKDYIAISTSKDLTPNVIKSGVPIESFEEFKLNRNMSQDLYEPVRDATIRYNLTYKQI